VRVWVSAYKFSIEVPADALPSKSRIDANLCDKDSLPVDRIVTVRTAAVRPRHCPDQLSLERKLSAFPWKCQQKADSPAAKGSHSHMSGVREPLVFIRFVTKPKKALLLRVGALHAKRGDETENRFNVFAPPGLLFAIQR
jgi:hypothetical protein